MFKEILVKAGAFLNLFDFENVVCYPSDEGNCCVSCKTDDDNVYMFVRNNKTGYINKEFSLRSWKSLYYVIDICKDEQSEDSGFKLQTVTNEYGYPSIMNIKSPRLSATHYLQNYSFISQQPDLLNLYNQRKFRLNPIKQGNANNLNETIMKDMRRLSTWLNDKYFRIEHDEKGNFFYLGDLNMSVDSVKLYIDGNGGNTSWDSRQYFNIDNFLRIFRFMRDEAIIDDKLKELKINLMANQIIFSYEANDILKVAIVRGINM